MTIAYHQMEGDIPWFTSTLSALILHKNRLKVLRTLHLKDNEPRTSILLHNNLLSCGVPWCGNTTAGTTIIAIGNRLRHPKGALPAWVSKHEHNPLFWVSDEEGMSILLKIWGGVLFFMLVIASKLDCEQLLSTVSRWRVGPADHLQLVQASSHLVSCLMKESLLAVVFLMCLLEWDLYVCPHTLAIASACLRNSALIRALVLLCYCKLSFHSQACGIPFSHGGGSTTRGNGSN